MPNRLAKEASLYLRQHQDNPVDWYPWGHEPFNRAKRENKPVLISIGYSSCHWCHVMAHESFENDYIASLMNEHFVCIKVDREEHPGVDQIYMDAVQMLNGHGGWPLNVFCLPDGRPFAGGTYFPPDDRGAHQIVPWPQLLMRIADFYKRQLPDLVKNAEAIAGNLQATNLPQAVGNSVLGADLFLDATHSLVEHHDPVFGGFGKAPKFPPSMSLGFLLAMRGSATVELHHRELAGKLDTVINRTLTGMAHGGIYDQIGGGFARYSVDSQWLIPHFEKMLYDNALLLDIYSRASHRYPKPLYQRIVEETIEWLERDMRAPEGAYYASLDADTADGEGSTYLWTPEEIESVLGPVRGAQFCKAYAITPEGNFENSGKSNPALLEADITVRDSLGSARRALLDARELRIQPTRDNKRLTAWNALLARGLVRAAFAFGRRDWLDSALSICEWIWEEMVSDGDCLFALSYGNGGQEPGTLDDYAFSAEAFLNLAAVVDWHYPGHSQDWIDRAVKLTDAALAHFSEPDEPGFFLTGKEHELLVHRKKAWFDNAIPSGNASMVQVLSCLSVLREDATYEYELNRLGQIYPGIVNAAPGAASYALSGFAHRAIGLAVVTCRNDADLESLRQALASRPWRPLFLVPDRTGQQKAAYQLCVGTQCLPPTDSATSVADLL